MSDMKVSIITTTYNDAGNLAGIMEEILKQDYENIEYIVVDGKSTDNTMEVLESYEPKFQGKMRYISEKDKGIYDALNKGISMATGDLVGCCFDKFADNHVISDMVAAVEQEGTDGVHGDLYYMDGDKIVRYWKQGQGNIRSGWMPGHPTLYLKRSIYEKYGLYKTDYRISADYEYMIRILKDNQVKLSYLNRVLIYMSHGGTSTNSLGSYLEGLKEGHRALKENNIKFAWWIDAVRTLRVLLQFVKRPPQPKRNGH